MQVGQAKLKRGLQVVSRLKLELALALRMGLHFEIIVVYVVNLGMPLSPMGPRSIMVPARMDLKKFPLPLYLWNSTSFCPVTQAFIQIGRSRLLTMYSDKWICG